MANVQDVIIWKEKGTNIKSTHKILNLN